MSKIDIRKILAEQTSEIETELAVKILGDTLSILSKQRVEAFEMFAYAAEFWMKRCELAERQRDELIAALDVIRKMAEERDFIPEDESEDFLLALWHNARDPVLRVRGEVE